MVEGQKDQTQQIFNTLMHRKNRSPDLFLILYVMNFKFICMLYSIKKLLQNLQRYHLLCKIFMGGMASRALSLAHFSMVVTSTCLKCLIMLCLSVINVCCHLARRLGFFRFLQNSAFMFLPLFRTSGNFLPVTHNYSSPTQ